MNNKINFNEILNSLIAAALILLACLGFIVAMIENPASCLLVLIFLIGTVAMIIVFNDNENVRRRN